MTGRAAAAIAGGMKVLILGGTTESSALAQALAARSDIQAVVSLAGRTERPALPAVATRIGGFGGPEGLAAWLREARVDAVVESVGQATWAHSVRSVRPGGTIAVCGATSGDAPPAELTRVFFNEIRVQGVTMGSREDLAALLRFCERTGVRPVVDSEVALADVRDGLARLAAGEQTGKIVVVP